MQQQQKQQVVEELKQALGGASSVVIVHYHGMNVDRMTQLRDAARKNGAAVRVTKNTLARIAANDSDLTALADLFSGPTAIAYSEDAVASAKTIVDFAKEEEALVIVGGALDGKALGPAEVKALASTPSLESSRAKIVGLLQAPASKLASVVQAPGGQVARVIGAYASSGSA